MIQHKELSRFSSNGKTFFFNHAKASNNSPYLVVNALYGKGRQERIILFEPHMAQFLRHLNDAVGNILGMKRVDSPEEVPSPTESDVPATCEECGFSPAKWEITVSGERHWCVTCECGNIVYTTEKE